MTSMPIWDTSTVGGGLTGCAKELAPWLCNFELSGEAESLEKMKCLNQDLDSMGGS